MAMLEKQVGLQKAMLLIPACYLMSGIAFLFADRILLREKATVGLPSARKIQ